MGTLIKNAFGVLVPPASASPERILAWRTAVFVALLALMIALVGHISQTTGWLGVESRWAEETDLQLLQLEVRGLARRSLESELLAVRTRQCQAMAANNNDATRYAGEALQSLRIEYVATHGYGYPLPTCREAGVTE